MIKRWCLDAKYFCITSNEWKGKETIEKTTLIIITVFWVLALLIVKITADYLYYPIVRVALEIRSSYSS